MRGKEAGILERRAPRKPSAHALDGPHFSVVIPTYNRAHLLGRAIRSVLDQTLQDFEIIVADDGSIDRTASIVEAFREPRIRLLRLAHRGANAARNSGIDAARGQLIAFLDSDDGFLSHHLTRMKELLDGTDKRAGYARVLVERDAGRHFQKPPRPIEPNEDMAVYLMSDRGFVQTSTLVVDAKLAREVRYDESLPFAQDMDFAIRLARAGCSFAMADEPGAIWRDTADADRISHGRNGLLLESWLEAQRPHIPERAYHGYRGWAIAKSLAAKNRSRALKLYVDAVKRGCYSPKLALTILLQILLSDRAYRAFADFVIARAP
ncbi:MAG: glycosyltransferase family 2 protein [Proteobacteria bacterium]|nr:glycosyltransferase family 2 protein [Pseudomonadota bacterium]